MKKLPFKGSGAALVTPFSEDNKIDYDTMSELIEMHINNKTDAIVVCGTTGEASTLSDDEQAELIGFSVKKANGRIPVIAGAGSNNTDSALRKVKRAAAAGADAILSVTPFYNKANTSGIVGHYERIANEAGIPVIIYNVPSRTGMCISAEALKQLSKIENIVGIKEASGNLAYVTKIMHEVPDLYIYSGNDDIVVPIMSLGGVGVISVCANILPNEFHDMCEKMHNGDIKSAAKMQIYLTEIINALFSEVNPIPIKDVMNSLGYHVGKTRLPLGEMSREESEKILRILEKYDVKKLI